MSVLESAAKLILTPIIVTEPHTIRVEAMIVLAQWVALKIMIGERSRPVDAVTPLEDRKSFKSSLEIPADFRIWIAKCGTGGWDSKYSRHSLTISKSPIPKLEHRHKNMHSVAFGIGDLFVLVIHTTVEGIFSADINHSEALLPLWPIIGPLTWPPPRSLSGSEAEALAVSLDRETNSPAIHWLPGPVNPVDGV